MAASPSEPLTRRRDYVTTFVAEGLFIVSYLIVFRLVADHFGPKGFAEYALARRTLAFMLPIGAIGLDIAIARYVAYAAGRPKEQRAYLPAALGLLVVAVGIESAVLLAFQPFWAGLFFGSAVYADLIAPLALMVAGNALFAVAYGNFRGHLRIVEANSLRVAAHAIYPFAAAIAVRGSVADLLYAIGGGWAILSLGALVVSPMGLDRPLYRARELATYSLPRAPGDLLALVLFALPGIIVAHVSDITVAGQVAFGIAALGMVASAVFPAGFVLLPVASRLLAAGSIPVLRAQVFGVARVIVALIVAGTVFFEIFATPIVTIYLGPAFAGSVTVLRVIMLGALPWGIYISLRSVIDAKHRRALNAFNVLLTFVLFSVLTLISKTFVDPAQSVVPIFVVSLYFLGVLTTLEVWRITRSDAEPVALPAEEPVAGEAAEPMV